MDEVFRDLFKMLISFYGVTEVIHKKLPPTRFGLLVFFFWGGGGVGGG